MPGKENPPFGEIEAQSIRDAGWRQGSVFSPPAGFPVPPEFDRGREWLVVCSQSCSVVSRKIDKDPYVELAAAEPIKTYNPKSAEALGKVLRHFHLPIQGSPSSQAVACDFYRRFFADRRLLLNYKPDFGIAASDADARVLAGWIARNYTRIALPDALVYRAKRGFFKSIERTLRTKEPAGGELSEFVDNIYISYTPELELEDGLYEVFLIFLCKDEEAERALGLRLGPRLQPYAQDGGLDGIKLTYDIRIRSQTLLSDLDAYVRLSEWDYLSDLGDVANSDI